MNLEDTGLILEGGGLRGVFTSGVLRFLMEKGLYFPYVIGVSMGACNAANYLSKQIGRNKIVNIEFVNDRRYLSLLRGIFKRELFGMNFIFNTIPNQLVPFDYDTFYNSDQKNWTVATDCISGKPVYYENKQVGKDYLKVLQASASLPFISRPVKFHGKILMDGGLADSIPIEKSISDGNQKHVIVLTRPESYWKPKSKTYLLAKLFYPRYKGLQQALKNRSQRYNDSLQLINKLEKAEKAFVIQPDEPLNIRKSERNKERLYRGYDIGYHTMQKQYNELKKFLK